MMRFCFSSEQRPVFASAGKFSAQVGRPHPTRCLDSHVLLLGDKHQCEIRQNGEEYTLGEGDYLILCAGFTHEGVNPVEVGQSHYWCHFYLDGAQPKEESESFSDSCISIPLFGHLAFPEEFYLLFHRLIDAEYREYRSAQAKEEICSCYTSIILQKLVEEAMSVDGKTIATGKSAVCSKIEEWIRLNAVSGISAVDVAKKFGYNADYISTLFHAETGVTLTRYINRTRLETAKAYLINSDMSVKEIANLCGFGDEKYFMRLFRRIEGVTPSAFRRTLFRLHINKE